MNEIIKISKEKIGNSSVNSVSARDLHKALGLAKDQFNRWIQRNLLNNKFFRENIDFATIRLTVELPNNGYREVTDYILTIDTAKHLTMLSQTEKAHQIRNYFIEIEKRFFEKSERLSVDEIREIKEISKELVELANIFGFSGNQAFLSADKGVRKITGNSPLEILDEKHLVSDSKDQILTPTQIGKVIEKSAIEVNLLLQDLGFQEKLDKVWNITEKGMQFAVMFDTNKKHSNGTPVKQIKWKSKVLDKLKNKN
jgi:phage anti-repressor protein